MKIILALILFSTSVFSQDKFFTYYNTWCMGTDEQWNTASSYYISVPTFASNLGNLTHVMVFMERDIVRSDYPPYLSITQDYIDNGGLTRDSLNMWYNGFNNPQSGASSWETRGTIFHLRDSLHANGKAILLTLQAVTASTGLNYVLADSARCDTFATAVANWVYRHDFDGVDLNTENSITFTDEELARLFRLLDGKMPDKLITCVPLPTQTNRYKESEPYVDFVIPQFYQYKSNDDPACVANSTFLSAPLHRDPYPVGSNHQDLTTWSPTDWVDSGWAKSKVVILLSNEANLFRDVDTMFSCVSTTNYYWSDTSAHAMLYNGGTYVWDDVHIGGYIYGTADTNYTNGISTVSAGQKFYIAVLDDENIDSVYTHFKALGYDNYGLYDVATDTRTPDAVKMPRHAYFSSILSTSTPSSTNKYLKWAR